MLRAGVDSQARSVNQRHKEFRSSLHQAACIEHSAVPCWFACRQFRRAPLVAACVSPKTPSIYNLPNPFKPHANEQNPASNQLKELAENRKVPPSQHRKSRMHCAHHTEGSICFFPPGDLNPRVVHFINKLCQGQWSRFGQ